MLSIVEIITRSRIEQQNLISTAPAEDSESHIQQVITINAKSMDKIFFDFGVEFKEIQIAMHFYMENSEGFEERLKDKEQEILECSV